MPAAAGERVRETAPAARTPCGAASNVKMIRSIVRRMPRWSGGLAGAMLALVIASGTAVAQERVTLQGDVLFYGDNTEFRNPFREGETIFGAAARVALSTDINDRVRLALGAFGNLSFGGDDAFELVRPIVTLEIHGPHGRRFDSARFQDRTSLRRRLLRSRPGPHGASWPASCDPARDARVRSTV